MFAMTVYFYSPAAYEYLQKLMPLPHKSFISKWVASVDCEPGFLTDVFKYIDLNPIVRDQFSDSCLIVDSMAIRKQVVWDQGTKQSTTYRYPAIAQRSVEDNEEIQIMCMRSVGDSAKVFKPDEQVESDVEFKQVLAILPNPNVKHARDTLYYEFPGNLDIFESG
ncbi:uncharacterized protein LOC126183595 isoform X1 [Schistocerca cancellata]|uniref:uncharacterized protein LOC126183595 isoform X1 n=1 Tax=Schistocerca cancellata TaxID=274614 RepID=UPI002119901E|nr:uncharacterized protein LOC126183595 isoform X1 [Schistocerca cancellata]XP_049781653.1 uncharacterized protein LOC126183595 isoform X1 [Schistocerca cancellata]